MGLSLSLWWRLEMGLGPILERHNAFQWDQFDALDAAAARCVHSLKLMLSTLWWHFVNKQECIPVGYMLESASRGGCLPGPGGGLPGRGVSAWSQGGSAWSGGWCLPGPGGVSAWSQGGLPGPGGGVCQVPGGWCLPGPGGVCLVRGVLASQHALRQAPFPLWTDRHL